MFIEVNGTCCNSVEMDFWVIGFELDKVLYIRVG